MRNEKDEIAIEMDVRLKFSLESKSKQALVHIAIAFNMLENYYLRPIKICHYGLVLSQINLSLNKFTKNTVNIYDMKYAYYENSSMMNLMVPIW